MIRIRNLAVPFTETASLKDLAAKRLMLPPQQLDEVVIVRKAVDARRYHGAPIEFVYMLDVKLDKKLEKKVLQKMKRDRNVEGLSDKPPAAEKLPNLKLEKRPVVVGFGPAGMFAALTLARHGCEPIVLERGHDVDTRHEDIKKFWQGGALDVQSNVQFGEGGAGTFSDGKLTTRINDVHMKDVIEAFIAAGAPEEIRYLHKPHIGTDILREVVRNIRKEIIRLGGTVRFSSQVTDLELGAEGVEAVIINDEERLETDVVFFGIGHSARDTYQMLLSRGVAMEAKPFAMGVRIEHPQEFIDRAQYGEDAGNPLLPVADYALTYKDPVTGRGAYSFCMCPGGYVVAAASEKDRVVTNGMSNYKRDSGIANSALLVQVAPADFGQEVLAGMHLQQKLESLAFDLGGRNYFAPVQTVGDFLKGTSGSQEFLTKPTYAPGVRAADLHRCLPDFITKTLAGALPYFDRKIAGFANEGAVMTGVETRSSAPCRIRRDRATFVAEATPGLYPMGEGAGYAGGIMSAAVDGMKAALAFLSENVHTNKM
ncbi:NAD(P)/FAD-dependent oxidoreductase [Mitsuokella sp. WILCCON 0060]|uniref:NAD(P)/FAD-dependent oxidoreductase n=1 Tax=Mitsuokella sp. WILCCON 0060 TaxID=3345341 RepID=UPI003F1BA6F3